MKRVITNAYRPDDVVDATDASENKYYGVLLEDGRKGFVTRADFNAGEFSVRCLKDLTMGNLWSAWTAKRLSVLLENVANSDCAEAFEFDTFEQLGVWLISPSE